MTGRGVDQILPYPSNPILKESFVKDARDYIKLAEEVNGKINYPVTFDYIWGDALRELEKEEVDIRIINLETTITTSENFVPKGINYRMNPKNVDVLKVFKVDIACLANNHILDFDEEGLLETIKVLNENGILTVGAGRNIDFAQKPVIIKKRGIEVIIFNYGDISSGIPMHWKADENKPGINLIDINSNKINEIIQQIKENIQKYKKENDFVIFSIHWGANWGYEISKKEREFAHRLIDEGGVDIVFGHSSHHFKGIEIYKGRLIVYGAGDFINDYEGIGGYEEFRGDLVLGYMLEINQSKIDKLILLPFRIKNFRLNYCSKEELDWIFNVLERESTIEGDISKEEQKVFIRLER